MKDPRFPELTQRQITILKTYGTIVSYEERTCVFKQGQNEYNFYIILKGEMEILDSSDEPNIITIHQKNEFSGDSSMLSNRSAQLNGFVTSGTDLIEIKPKDLKEAISKYSDISDKLLSAFLLRQETVLSDYKGGIKLLGSGNSKATYEIIDFMDKNHLWYSFLDTDKSDNAKSLLEHFNITEEDLPAIISNETKLYSKPGLEQIARCSGILTEFENKVFDVLVVGAGPAGLAASVYAASEGLSVVTIDNKAPGGQAGKSSKIENYLGFPTGISGSDLANRAYIQAQKFGCNISIPQTAKKIKHQGSHFQLEVTNGKDIKTRSVIIATGASYRRLPVEDIEKFEGSGVYYSATGMNISSCQDEIVGVVGGGNSAGQAAMFLSNYAKEVHIFIRGGDLGAKMSNYLVQRIEACENIIIETFTEVTNLLGEHHLESIETTSNGVKKNMPVSNLFTFVGAAPCTEWMSDLVVSDKKGFIYTGNDLDGKEILSCGIFKKRNPYQLETSIPGLFAVGDVRSGSTKRVASAVGEGSICISQVHQFLGDLYEVEADKK